MQTVTPEFLKSEQQVLDAATKAFASLMTEQELKDTAAFYESPTGKKFVLAQVALANRVAAVATRVAPAAVGRHAGAGARRA